MVSIVCYAPPPPQDPGRPPPRHRSEHRPALPRSRTREAQPHRKRAATPPGANTATTAGHKGETGPKAPRPPQPTLPKPPPAQEDSAPKATDPPHATPIGPGTRPPGDKRPRPQPESPQGAHARRPGRDKIKNLLSKGAVNNMTSLVLVNAIYFNADWDKKFKANYTFERLFKLNKNEIKPVQMMEQTGNFGLAFIPEVDCQILEMPYIGKELSMLIILPSEIEDDSTGLERLERELTYEKLIQWTQPDMMKSVEVNVALPKFKMEETYDLRDILVSMGMEDAFDESKSDLTGISSSTNLVVSKVVHKAFVEVNEEGTEAAAATAVTMILHCGRLYQNHFIANHPFLFFIRHNPTQSILFCGQFCSP
ncbi:serpin B6-like [Conger conger]|uniref:serpin B6-like n=1 Tax=Conger conger TaxID=82655 RepID=UPI002A5A0179|nr:serpin B6-like [Conger conger]